MTPDDLDKCRTELDAIDAELIRLMSTRLELGLAAARIKRSRGLPIADPAREKKVITQARDWAVTAGVSPDEVEEIFRRLISLSRQAQQDSR
jgi:chorismate mutase-like protein